MSELFSEDLDLSAFPAATLAEWRAAAEVALKGKPLAKLTTRTQDGLEVEPLYQRENASFLPGAEHDPGEFPYVRGAKGKADWVTVESPAPVVEGLHDVAAAEVHEEGGGAVQEVAYAWTEGLRILREFCAEGASVDQAAARIRFTFAAGGEFFVILAKLRAARFGWARIITASGGSEAAAKMSIHARTSRWQQSVLDAHTNILRSTASAYAAVLGGCDSLEVLPFDEVFREPTELSRRLALNTQRILREECHAAAVTDPGGGSWFIENLTREIAGEAWTAFQGAEKGGQPDCLAGGAEAQRAALSKRRRIMVGVNQYADPAERVPLGGSPGRLSGEFELLRLNAGAYAERHGARPKIFLLTMGALKQHKARADFVRSFLEPAGFDVVYPDGFSSAGEAVRAALAAGALASVLCSTDETYSVLVPEVLAEMRGEMPVILAGYPESEVEAFKAAGIADFIHLRADCGAFLSEWQRKLGVSS